MTKRRTALLGALAALFFLKPAVCAADFYYPLDDSLTWVYSATEKKEGGITFTAEAVISEKQSIEGKVYAFFNAPSVNVRFLVRIDEKGGYMKVIKYPYPIFNNISYDVYVEPEIIFIKFPLVAGEKWEQVLQAKAVVFGFFTFDRSIKMSYENLGEEELLIGGKPVKAWHILMYRDEGDGGPMKKEESWYADGIGYVKGETEANYIMLKEVTGVKEE